MVIFHCYVSSPEGSTLSTHEKSHGWGANQKDWRSSRSCCAPAHTASDPPQTQYTVSSDPARRDKRLVGQATNLKNDTQLGFIWIHELAETRLNTLLPSPSIFPLICKHISLPCRLGESPKSWSFVVQVVLVHADEVTRQRATDEVPLHFNGSTDDVLRWNHFPLCFDSQRVNGCFKWRVLRAHAMWWYHATVVKHLEYSSKWNPRY